MKRSLALIISVAAAACATLDEPTAANLAQYCTAQNAYRLGSQSRAYTGVCPKETEAQFVQGLARGRTVRRSTPVVEPIYQQMERAEQALAATSSEPERRVLRERLADLEWWALHLLNQTGTYMH